MTVLYPTILWFFINIKLKHANNLADSLIWHQFPPSFDEDSYLKINFFPIYTLYGNHILLTFMLNYFYRYHDYQFFKTQDRATYQIAPSEYKCSFYLIPFTNLKNYYYIIQLTWLFPFTLIDNSLSEQKNYLKCL